MSSERPNIILPQNTQLSQGPSTDSEVFVLIEPTAVKPIGEVVDNWQRVELPTQPNPPGFKTPPLILYLARPVQKGSLI